MTTDKKQYQKLMKMSKTALISIIKTDDAIINELKRKMEDR